jgi:hypothetical protein
MLLEIPIHSLRAEKSAQAGNEKASTRPAM